MVRLIPYIRTALLLAAVANAAPTRKRDSAVGDEVAVSAPNGTPVSDLAALSTQLSSSATAVSIAQPLVTAPPSDDSSDSSDDTDSSDDDSSDDDSSDDDSSDYDSSDYDSSDYDSSDSSYDSSDSTYDSSDSSYDSSDSSYDSSDSSYDSSDSGYGSVSSGSSYNYPSYGSGSSSWISDYNNCVQTCLAMYQPPPSVYYPPTVTSGSSYGGSADPYDSDDVSSDGDDATIGASVTHTIIVAPTQGVLRYVPFITNAAVGDVLEFQWGAGPHTVTRSSELTPCNKTLDSDVFASGMQQKGFIFHETVNDTNTIFYYCGVPGHCEKGMFGIINPPSASPSSNTTVAALMPQWAAADPDIMTANNFVQSKAAGTVAENWGADTDVSGIDQASYPELARNVLYTRYFIALNPTSVDSEGNFRPTSNLKIPPDLSSLLAQASAGSNSTAASGSASAPAANTTGAYMSGSSGSTPNGAASLSSSTVTVAIAAIVAAFFAF